MPSNPRSYLACALAFVASTLAHAQAFTNPYRIPTSTDPYGVTVADFNGDGRPDIAWIDPTTSPEQMHVLLARGDGSFVPVLPLLNFSVALTTSPRCRAADFNNDGHQDLACSQGVQFDMSVLVFFGNGDGTFQPPIATAVPTESNGAWVVPVVYLAGDLNGDGFTDLIIEEAQSQEVQVLLGDNKGSFEPGIVVQSGYNYPTPFIADVNGDGKPDILWPVGPEVALGNGDGTFGQIADYSEASYYAATCTFHDMDGDGHLDAVCGYADTNDGDLIGGTELIILHGNPDGSFNTTPISDKSFGGKTNAFDGFGTFQFPVSVADLNGDGIPDVIGSSGDGLAILLGGPGLSFSTPLHYAEAFTEIGTGIDSAYESQIVDMNGDGIPDIVACGPNGIYISYAKNDGSFASAPAFEAAEVIAYATVADFNGDGIPDVVASGDSSLQLSLGKGDGTFLSPTAIPGAGVDFSSLGAHLAHGDFNGDGKQDLIAIGQSSSGYSSFVLFGHGDGTFSSPILVPNSAVALPMYEQLSDVSVFDINHDGRSDILGSSNTTNTTSPNAQIFFSLSNGDGTFKSVTTNVPGDPENEYYSPINFPALADFNHDGKLDAAYGSITNAYVVKGHGDGTFDTTGTPLPLPSIPDSPYEAAAATAAGDFDGDGNQDFVVLTQYGSNFYQQATTSAAWVFYGNGNGTFSAPVLAGTFDRPYTGIAASDLNGDGLSDLIVQTSGSLGYGYAVGVIDSHPGRTFGPEVNYTAGTGLSSLSIADLNHDGRPDLVFANGDFNVRASSVTVLLNLGATSGSPTTTTLTSSLNPSTYGQSVTFKATVSAATTPTGSITFTDGATTLTTVSLNASADATYTTSSLTANDPGTTPNHPITATYNPPGSFATSSASLSQVVNGLPTTNTLTISPASGTTATTYTLTATLKSASTVSTATPTGTVTFYISPTNGDPGIQIGTATLTNGVATLTSSTLPVSSGFAYEIYAGDTIYANSDSNSINVNITAAPTTITTLAITAAGSPVTAVPTGTVVTLTATTLAGTSPVTPGVIHFCDATAPACTDIHLIGTAQLTASGTAILRFIPGPGTHSYKAVFLGTSTSNTSSSAAEPLTVGSSSNATTTTLAATGAPGDYTLTATVTGSLTTSPTGTISFLDTTNSNYVLATAPLSPSTPSGPTFVNSSTLTLPIPSGGILAAGTGMAVGDFNGDGLQDLAILESPSPTFGLATIFLGDGTGSFAISSSFATGVDPTHIITADFNGDGFKDLAFSDLGSQQAEIWLNDGHGNFTFKSSYPTSAAPQGVVAADFNGDGIPDLAVVNGFGGLVILLGNGDGTFTPIPGPATGNLPIEIASADFNGDGIADLAVANSGDNTISILLGNGDGTFTLKQNASAGLTPSGLVVGDFNGDGKVDFVEVDVNGNGGALDLGQGDGTFIVSTNLNTGNAPYGLAIGDFNGDGIADLITTNFSGTTVTIILGAGNGSFVSSPPLTTINNPVYVATGDFNGDGKSDFAITNGGTNTIPIYLSASSTGTATASATVTNISPVGTGPHLVDASYPGDSTYAASLSNTVSLTAQRVPTTLALTASIAPSGSPITLNAALSPNFAQNHAATGLVTFSSNGNTLGTGSISNGAATLVVTSLPAGTDALQAQYAGDTNFAPSSGTGSITVVPPPPPDFTFTGPTTITFRTESNGTATLVLTSFAGFAAPISITCNDPLPPNYLCTLSNSRVSLTANATASINLTLHPNLNAALTPPAGRRNPTLPIAFAALFPIALLTLYRRRTRTLTSALLLLLCFAALTTALTACGSDIYYPATPPGIYPISLTATGTTQGSPTPTTHTLVVNANITP